MGKLATALMVACVVALLCVAFALPAFGMASKQPAAPADLSASLSQAQAALAASQAQAKAATEQSGANAQLLDQANIALKTAQDKAGQEETELKAALAAPHPSHLILGFILGSIWLFVTILILLYKHSAQVESYETRIASMEAAGVAKVEALAAEIKAKV